jgi:hypothetical protein
MARLPGGTYLVQQIGPYAVVFHEFTEQEEAVYTVGGGQAAIAGALAGVADSSLDTEDRCFAAFWFGYFHGHACESMPGPVTCGALTVSRAGSEVRVEAASGAARRAVVAYPDGDGDAAARAQREVSESGASEHDRLAAHFWCGAYWAWSSQGHLQDHVRGLT